MEQSFILASRSPRRIELLRQLGLEVIVRPSTFDESRVAAEDPEEFVRAAAAGKGREVALRSHRDHPELWIVSADTIVVLDGRMLGKPAGADGAAAMLGRLSGNWHTVFSGVCLFQGTTLREHFVEASRVRFKPLTAPQIEAYLATGEPLDKAGAYGIQAHGRQLIESIEGDYHNIVGLPVHRLCAALNRLAPHFSLQPPPRFVDRLPD